MFDWWVQLPPFLRTTVALVPLAAGVVCFLLGLWRWGIPLTVLGAVLFAVSFPRPSERRGYHD